MSATIGVREGVPAVNVKDGVAYAHNPKCAAAMEPLSADRVEAIYEGVARDFWEFYAPQIARDHGYNGTVWSTGRSGGWLYLDDLSDFAGYDLDRASAPEDWTDIPEEIAEVNEAFARFQAFAEAITAELDYCREQFLDRLKEAVEADEHEANERAYWSARDVLTIP